MNTTTSTTVGDESTATILSAISTLPQPHLSSLLESVLAATHHRHRRISAIVSSPTLFSLALLHLLSLSLPLKSLLISRLLLFSLRSLTLPFTGQHSSSDTSDATPCVEAELHCPRDPKMMPADHDAVLLLLLLCDLQHRHPQALDEASPSEWRLILKDLCRDTMLSLSGIGSHNGGTLVPFIETVVRGHRFVNSMTCPIGGGGNVAASAAAVVGLPSVEVRGGGEECAVCWEEMREGREVCKLPCEHCFHWLCILPWLRKRNTCPSCRHELPTDDVFGEIQRLWNLLMKRGKWARAGRWAV